MYFTNMDHWIGLGLFMVLGFRLRFGLEVFLGHLEKIAHAYTITFIKKKWILLRIYWKYRYSEFCHENFGHF